MVVVRVETHLGGEGDHQYAAVLVAIDGDTTLASLRDTVTRRLRELGPLSSPLFSAADAELVFVGSDGELRESLTDRVARLREPLLAICARGERDDTERLVFGSASTLRALRHLLRCAVLVVESTGGRFGAFEATSVAALSAVRTSARLAAG